MAEVDQGVVEELATADDRRDHMRGTLELIAGTQHSSSELHGLHGDPGLDTGIFFPDTCPVCMARTCLDQVDAAEGAELEL